MRYNNGLGVTVLPQLRLYGSVNKMDLIQQTSILYKYYMRKTFRKKLLEKEKNVVTCNDVPPGSVSFFILQYNRKWTVWLSSM